MFQESSVASIPWCYYPDDYGYTVDNEQITADGIVVDLSLPSRAVQRYRAISTPINKLRLQVTYHKNDMLQFKVNLFSTLYIRKHYDTTM